jgi:hypothetical protein
MHDDKLTGRARCLRAIHVARWLMLGSWDEALLAEAARLEWQTRLTGIAAFVVDWALLRGAAAGLVAETVTMYAQLVPKPLTAVPKDMRSSRHMAHSLYVVCCYLSGGTEFAQVATATASRWASAARAWTEGPTEFAWEQRLYWTWIHNRHWGGPTDPEGLIMELRGF